MRKFFIDSRITKNILIFATLFGATAQAAMRETLNISLSNPKSEADAILMLSPSSDRIVVVQENEAILFSLQESSPSHEIGRYIFPNKLKWHDPTHVSFDNNGALYISRNETEQEDDRTSHLKVRKFKADMSVEWIQEVAKDSANGSYPGALIVHALNGFTYRIQTYYSGAGGGGGYTVSTELAYLRPDGSEIWKKSVGKEHSLAWETSRKLHATALPNGDLLLQDLTRKAIRIISAHNGEEKGFLPFQDNQFCLNRMSLSPSGKSVFGARYKIDLCDLEKGEDVCEGVLQELKLPTFEVISTVKIDIHGLQPFSAMVPRVDEYIYGPDFTFFKTASASQGTAKGYMLNADGNLFFQKSIEYDSKFDPYSMRFIWSEGNKIFQEDLNGNRSQIHQFGNDRQDRSTILKIYDDSSLLIYREGSRTSRIVKLR